MRACSPFSTNCCARAFTTLAASARSWAGAERRGAERRGAERRRAERRRAERRRAERRTAAGDAQRRAAVRASDGIPRGEIERGQGTLSGLADLAADLAGEAEALQAHDLALSFQPSRV